MLVRRQAKAVGRKKRSGGGRIGRINLDLDLLDLKSKEDSLLTHSQRAKSIGSGMVPLIKALIKAYLDVILAY